MNDLDDLYRRHAPALLRYAWGLCGDRAAAEDLVSETFVRVLTRAPDIETRTALGYLLAVARNTYLSRRRHERRETAVPETLADTGWDPETRLADRERLACVREAWAELSEAERSALLLRVDHELPYEDVAAVLGIRPGAAKLRVHRARVRLARRLERIRREP